MRDTRATLDRFYSAHRLARLGDPADARCLGWSSREAQEARFDVLARVGPLEGASILDAGCGFGDLYGWLAERYRRFSYVGVDLLPEMIDVARAKWQPDGSTPGDDTRAPGFVVGDPAALFPSATFDYVLASGMLTVYEGPDPLAHLRQSIRALFDLSRRGFAFNLLDARVRPSSGALLSFRPDEALAACKVIPADVELADGYLEGDFTIFARARPPRQDSVSSR